jgi:hypothetical protein
MMKVLALSVFFAASAHAYVPTVESLFRHGSNPDVSTNGVSLTLKVKRIQAEEKTSSNVSDASLLKDQRAEDFYRIFFTRSGETLKVSQARYNSGNFSESSLLHKTYYPNFSSYTIKADIESAEKGIFFGLLQSLALNNGAPLINYMKALGVPVRLNSEIINREKVEFLADYKRYLVLVSKDRNARKTEVNPMYPDDSAAREKAQAIMAEPMYTDLKQVKLSRDENQIAWVVNAGTFEAVVSYKLRDLQRIRYKSPAGDFEVIMKDYWLANGTHAMPRFMQIKLFNGEQYLVEITNLRHYVEKEDDLVKRLRNWDQILKGKESTEARPEFLL